MAFCSKCVKKIDDGVKFCVSCDTQIAASVPSEGVFVVVTPEQMKANTAQSITNQEMTEIQASWRGTPVTTVSQKKKSKLLLIAAIVAPVLWTCFMYPIFIESYIGVKEYENNPNKLIEDYRNKLIKDFRNRYEWAERFTDEQLMDNWIKDYEMDMEARVMRNKFHVFVWKEMEMHYEANKWDMRSELISFVVVIVFIAIPTLLNVQGQRKNSSKMILSAGILYVFTVVGILSAIMCFVAYAKMRKTA